MVRMSLSNCLACRTTAEFEALRRVLTGLPSHREMGWPLLKLGPQRRRPQQSRLLRPQQSRPEQARQLAQRPRAEELPCYHCWHCWPLHLRLLEGWEPSASLGKGKGRGRDEEASSEGGSESEGEDEEDGDGEVFVGDAAMAVESAGGDEAEYAALGF